MGGNSSKNDQRSISHKVMEESMGMQLMIPHKEFRIPSEIKLLAIGHFVNGEFCPISNLDVMNVLNIAPEVHERTHSMQTSHQYELDVRNTTTVHIRGDTTVFYIHRSELNKCFEGKHIHKRRYGITNEFYVVSEVHKSGDFMIISRNASINHDVPSIPKVYGYKLMRFKTDSKGKIKVEKNNNKVY